jgi:hypothetical protein
MRKVSIAIPAYTGQVHIGTFRSIFTDVLDLYDRGDHVFVMDECGNALLADARALMVAKFLDSDGTDLIFVDNDVVWEAGTLLKLVDAPVDFVAAIYPQRNDPINYSVSWDQSKQQLIPSEHGLLEVWGVPLGCARVSRVMLEKMIEVYSDTEFYCEKAPGQKAHALFGDYRLGRYKLGEDFAFCARWRNIGGQVWISPECNMGHVGFKTFRGNIGEWLRNRGDEDGKSAK